MTAKEKLTAVLAEYDAMDFLYDYPELCDKMSAGIEAYAAHKSAEDNRELVDALQAMYDVYPYGGKGDVNDREKACELAKKALKKTHHDHP